MAINTSSVDLGMYEELLMKFNPAYHERLAMYTCEELYYVYRICTFKAKPNKDGMYATSDITYLALKRKLMSYLQGKEKHSIYPNAFDKLGKRFRSQYNTLYIEIVA